LTWFGAFETVRVLAGYGRKEKVWFGLGVVGKLPFRRLEGQ